MSLNNGTGVLIQDDHPTFSPALTFIYELRQSIDGHLVLIHKRFRYELKPNNKQRTLFQRAAGISRFTWNWGLARRVVEYDTTGKSLNAMEQHKQLTKLKKADYPWMYEVSKCVPQQALRDLDNAYKHFFRRMKIGKKPGFPRFKKKGRSKDSFSLRGYLHAKLKRVKLPRIGWVRTKEVTAVVGRILSATISREIDRWYVSFGVEQDIPEPVPVQGPVVGIDLGINKLAVISDRRVIENPKALQRGLKKLRRLSKEHSRKQKGSKNRKKTTLRLARHHRRIRNIRNDTIHKATTELAKTKSVIVVEDLNMKGMMKNRRLARYISDTGWGEFVRQLGYKCQWYGSKLVKIDRWFPSSKLCSQCGAKKDDLTLSDRIFICPECGYLIDRDLNAAVNIMVAGSSSETGNACGAGVRPQVEAIGVEAGSEHQRGDVLSG